MLSVLLLGLPHMPAPRNIRARHPLAIIALGCLLLAMPAIRGPEAREPAAADIEFILRAPPDPASPEQAAWRRLADAAVAIRKLPLSGAEVWRVPNALRDVLRQTAARSGVDIVEPDKASKLLSERDAAAPMTSRAQSMMSLAMASRSSMTMATMAVPSPDLVEYALTRDGQAGSEPSLEIALTSGKVIQALRRTLELASDHYVWRGVVAGTSNPVTVLWWPTGRLSGSVHLDDRIYQFRHLDSGVIGVIETMPVMLPDDHPRTSPERMNEMRMHDDAMFREGDASAMRRTRPRRDETESVKDEPVSPRAAAFDPRRLDGVTRSGGTEEPVVIDVLIAYTRKAAAHYDDIRRDLLDLAIADGNQSYLTSGIPDISLRLVGAVEVDYDESGAEHFDHVWRMVDRGDGHLEKLPPLRDQLKADVVILIVDDASGCGLATRVAADAEEAYAVVHHECAAASYSIPHEIGHLIGARHDRSLDQQPTPYPHGHGYVSPDLKWRTIMSYKAGCSGCPRLPVWSNPELTVHGAPAGDAMSDNARVIRERARRVSQFR